MERQKKARPGMIRGEPSFVASESACSSGEGPVRRRRPVIIGLTFDEAGLIGAGSQKCGPNYGEACVHRRREFNAHSTAPAAATVEIRIPSHTAVSFSIGEPSIVGRSRSDHPTADSTVSASPASCRTCATAPRACRL